MQVSQSPQAHLQGRKPQTAGSTRLATGYLWCRDNDLMGCTSSPTQTEVSAVALFKQSKHRRAGGGGGVVGGAPRIGENDSAMFYVCTLTRRDIHLSFLIQKSPVPLNPTQYKASGNPPFPPDRPRHSEGLITNNPLTFHNRCSVFIHLQDTSQFPSQPEH